MAKATTAHNGTNGTPPKKTPASFTAATATASTSTPPSMPSAKNYKRSARAKKKPNTACATGASVASATGAARYRSSTTPTAATCRLQTKTCPSSCRKTSSRTAAAHRLPNCPNTLKPQTPQAAPPAAKPTPWTPSSNPAGTSSATCRPTTPAAWSLRKTPPTGRTWTNTSAASSTPSSTCSTPASSPN